MSSESTVWSFGIIPGVFAGVCFFCTVCVCVGCKGDSAAPLIRSRSDSSLTSSWQTTAQLCAELLEYSWHLLLGVNSWDTKATLNQFRFSRFGDFFLSSNVIFSLTNDSHSAVLMWNIFSLLNCQGQAFEPHWQNRWMLTFSSARGII